MNLDEAFQEPSAADLAALAKFMPTFDATQAVEKTTKDTSNTPDIEAPTRSDDEFEFRLFDKSERVRIEEPVEVVYESPKRPQSYYQQMPDSERTRRIRDSVIDGDKVRADSMISWPGCFKSRRSTLIKIEDSKDKKPKRRWRPSKQRRDTFKKLKAIEEQKKRQRIASRLGRGSAQKDRGLHKKNIPLKTSSKTSNKLQVKSGGYPRKSGPPV